MSTLFLFCAAFFPRLTLLVCYLFAGLPLNSTPFGVDLLCAFFCPRLLVAWWAFESGQHPLVVGLFCFLELAEKFRGLTVKSSSSSSSKGK